MTTESPKIDALSGRMSGVRARRLLVLIAALAALAYAWGINRDPLEPYYEAAVRSMAMSWHNFFFGTFDPAGTITLDKLPGAFWVQAVFVWIFGFHTWSIVLPQVIEGVLAVVFLYRAVERLMGPVAGLLAALILAASPATVALNRGNISDTAMTLLLVLAANSVSAAMVSGRPRHLVAAGIWVGLAFQTKMIEAWLVLPALGLAYLLSGTGPTLRKLWQATIGGIVAAVLSLSWMVAVTVIPSSARPYVDGSAHNSIFDQVFVYNGFGRFGQATPLQLLAGQNLNLNLVTSPPASWNRLFAGDLGRDTGWLLPAALVVAVMAVIFSERRSYYVMWGGWLVTMVLVFSVTSTINSYYTAALSPAVAAILGAGAAEVWARPPERGAVRTRLYLVAALVVGGTVGYGIWLAQTAPGSVPGWLWPVAAGLGVVAVVTVLSSRSAIRGVAASTAAMLILPAAASALLVSEYRGAFDTPFQSPAAARAADQLFVDTPRLVQGTIPRLERIQLGAPYLLATQTSAVASVFIDASGKEALPIGGFTGTIPEPTLTQLKDDVAAGKFHLVLAAPSKDPRLMWIESHCLPVGTAAGSLHSYFCTKADALKG